ncbi:calcium-activated chloride channel regulator 1-like [Pelobates fuscus]|uniref:calcium-activated chloride channel regulator 1-like n=1 Tax=Pelobates fuscus TaxID=191477 RepID=UPI002FE44E9D
MGLQNVFAILLVFHLCLESQNSMVKLNNGGYEDIVIAINPGLTEDIKIIENIKDMVSEATQYLFNATKNRLFIRSAKILIPLHWSSSTNYLKPTTETYDGADVIIANPYLKYGDDPYTLQYGKCGEPGKYIHLTPNFLKNDTLLDVYGPRGRVFVHEWAHLRWGVFDEYSTETPYYIHREKVEATRCSADIFGVNVKCGGDSCAIEACNFDKTTGLYEEGCFFVYDKEQFVSESIMYLQSLPTVSQFCDDSNHNIHAPNLQNKLCDYQSTWDVVKNSDDIKNTSPVGNVIIPEPMFSLLQYKERVITLVLDVSGSMSSYGRIGRLYQAAEIFLIQIIETNSYVGIVEFHTTPNIKSHLVQIIGDEQRQELKALLPQKASGYTYICDGMTSGIKVNKELDGSTAGTELVLLSDGEATDDTSRCASEILASGAILHLIALGPSASEALKGIVKETGGLHFVASDAVDSQGLIDAFSSLSAANGDITHQSIQLESMSSNLKKSECLNGTVFIDSTVGNETFFLVTWQTAVPSINLQNPKGGKYNENHFSSDTSSKSSRLQVPGTAERGPWIYNLCNRQTRAEAIGITVNSKAANINIPPITVNAHMDKDTNNPPNPMIIYASVSQGLMPVKGAKVTAIIESATGRVSTVELLDNGAGADIVKNDGVYSRYFTDFTDKGRYSLKVRVESDENKSRLVVPKNRALYVPGYIENGTIHMNPTRPEVKDEDLSLGAFSRTSSGGSFILESAPSSSQPDVYKPEKITDLEANIEDQMITLTWTATGDDLDKGNASRYDLRMSTDLKGLRENFINATQVNISSLIPQEAGFIETFRFAPENVVIENGTVLFFAIVAIDKVSQKSDPSNIAQAALFVPPTPAPTEATTTKPTLTHPNTNDSNSLNITYMTLIVCSAAIIISIIISITLCIVSCLKKRKDPELRL